MTYRVITTFEEIPARARRRGKCPTCGKPVVRSRTFTMTVNPFNKNPDGSVRTRREVWIAVSAEAQAWDPTPDVFEHQRCYNERGGSARE
jgi:hypothetical protein